MAILLPALPIAFGAFCVWLIVRIVNRRERWAKWTLAGVVGVPVLYVASFGPACWFASRDQIEMRFVAGAYRPLIYAATLDPTLALATWADCGTPDGAMIFDLLLVLHPEPGPTKRPE